MTFNLQIRGPSIPRFSIVLLEKPLRAVREIMSRNVARSNGNGETRAFKNCKEEMKKQLKAWDRNSNFETTIEGGGGPRVLISLFLEYSGRSDGNWLPPFDGSVAEWVLGKNGGVWHAGRRRQFTQLFFTHFDRLSGLRLLSERLFQAYQTSELPLSGAQGILQAYKEKLFRTDGPTTVAQNARTGETLPQIMKRFAVPIEGRFSECLRQVFLLNALRDAPLGQEVSALKDIEALKHDHAQGSLLMGAAALQIMVRRSASEGGGHWNGDWSKWLARLGCDPRHGRATLEGTKWWGWATEAELRLAQKGITGFTLEFFIDFLSGTVSAPQWKQRADFLLALFRANKIESARLALNWSALQYLDRKYHDLGTVAQLSETTDQTSMICLRCVDGVHIIEGTHSFGLRMFHRSFPILDFWESPRRKYRDRDLRIDRERCSIFLRHDPWGNWVRTFFFQLRSQFHVEWRDVRV